MSMKDHREEIFQKNEAPWTILGFKDIHELIMFVNQHDEEIKEFKIIPIENYGECYLCYKKNKLG